MHLRLNEEVTYTRYGVPRYSERFKDVLHRFYEKQEQIEKPHIQNHKFHRLRMIGIGASSMVDIVFEQDSRALYAQKIIKKSANLNARQLAAQIKIHLYLDHENLIKLYHCYSDENSVYLLMELGQESLFAMKNRGHRFTSEEILNILKQVVKGISYMHSKNLVHADLKLENIVITSTGTIKICDFGYTHKVHESLEKQTVRTLEYLPPQYVQGIDSGFMRDIWAVGIVCYELLQGINPIQNLPQEQKWLQLLNFNKQNLSKWQLPEVQSPFKQVISKCLCFSEERATASELLDILEMYSPTYRSAYLGGTLEENLNFD